MAHIRLGAESGFYRAEIHFENKRYSCSLLVKNKCVADAIGKKISLLEDAVKTGLTAEEIGLADWIQKVEDHCPKLYEVLVSSGLVSGRYNDERILSDIIDVVPEGHNEKYDAEVGNTKQPKNIRHRKVKGQTENFTWNDDEYLDSKTLCNVLHLSHGSVSRLRSLYGLPWTKLGGTIIRHRWGDVKKWIEENQDKINCSKSVKED